MTAFAKPRKPTSVDELQARLSELPPEVTTGSKRPTQLTKADLREARLQQLRTFTPQPPRGTYDAWLKMLLTDPQTYFTDCVVWDSVLPGDRLPRRSDGSLDWVRIGQMAMKIARHWIRQHPNYREGYIGDKLPYSGGIRVDDVLNGLKEPSEVMANQVVKRKKTVHSPEKKQAVMNDVRGGLTVKAASEKHGIPIATINYWKHHEKKGPAIANSSRKPAIEQLLALVKQVHKDFREQERRLAKLREALKP